MSHPLRSVLRTGLAAMLIALLMGCGTLIYPERRGQADGKLDTDIVILDAVGLLLFLVPGVVAFAVDFATGAIYLPKGGKSKSREALGKLEIERHPLPSRDLDEIVAFVQAETGHRIDRRRLEIARGQHGPSVASQLAELQRPPQTARAHP